jgi:hypothetical protein
MPSFILMLADFPSLVFWRAPMSLKASGTSRHSLPLAIAGNGMGFRLAHGTAARTASFSTVDTYQKAEKRTRRRIMKCAQKTHQEYY